MQQCSQKPTVQHVVSCPQSGMLQLLLAAGSNRCVRCGGASGIGGLSRSRRQRLKQLVLAHAHCAHVRLQGGRHTDASRFEELERRDCFPRLLFENHLGHAKCIYLQREPNRCFFISKLPWIGWPAGLARQRVLRTARHAGIPCHRLDSQSDVLRRTTSHPYPIAASAQQTV